MNFPHGGSATAAGWMSLCPHSNSSRRRCIPFFFWSSLRRRLPLQILTKQSERRDPGHRGPRESNVQEGGRND